MTNEEWNGIKKRQIELAIDDRYFKLKEEYRKAKREARESQIKWECRMYRFYKGKNTKLAYRIAMRTRFRTCARLKEQIKVLEQIRQEVSNGSI